MHVILSSYNATEIIDTITEMELYPKYFPEINQYLHNMNSIYLELNEINITKRTIQINYILYNLQ